MAFRGTDRFELRGQLGEGGMGVVYEAYDRVRGMRVALKTLRRVSAMRLLRFKREFRTLSSLSHPNIITLYELVAEGRHWFFTMELIDGQDLVAHVRRDRAQTQTTTATLQASGDKTEPDEYAALRVWAGEQPGPGDDTLPTRSLVSMPPGMLRPGSAGDSATQDVLRPALDELIDRERLRSALAQLASALHTLHAAGLVHRDLKPSNVLVTAEGRVVLMDFGIVAEVRRSNSLTGVGVLQGTPAFMSPEQVRADPLTPATDWYAFGVILYLLLTGRLPYGGTREQVLLGKQAFDPPPPSTLTRGIPEELEQLCMRLLARPAADRPSGAEVLATLGGATAHQVNADSSAALATATDVFVGRDRELAALRASYAAVQRGGMQCVIVDGPSGMGKTSLVERFMRELVDDRAVRDGSADREPGGRPPLVLSGHCHERESLAYKAFDGIMDHLANRLLELPQAERNAILPSDIILLTRLFPVLRRVPECDVTVTLAGIHPVKLRTQAIHALRGLLAVLAREHPIVIRIEDLQWADRDSIRLLLGLLEPPEPAGLLCLATVRADVLDTASGRPLAEFLASIEDKPACRRLSLGPLSGTEQRMLVTMLSGDRLKTSSIDDRLLQDASGHPMLLAELARYAQEVPHGLPRLGLEDVLWRRIARLPDVAQLLLEAIAVAGEPAPLSILARTAGLSHSEGERALASLELGRLVRVARTEHEPWLDAYHDKVREAIAERVPDERSRALNRGLAAAIEAASALPGGAISAPVARLARHWLAAGEREKAVSYLMEAARSAANQLAFERAAELYRTVLDLLAAAGSERNIELLRCRAWIGLIESLRIHDRVDEALAVVDRALAVASAHYLVEELADIHYLRGSLLFPRGDLDGCLESHERARALAKRAGSPRREALALSGLGDAYYMRGQMITAYEHYNRCIDLCHRHDYADIEAANLTMRGVTRFYQNDLEAALRDGTDAAEIAARVGHQRAEISARVNCLGLVWSEFGRIDRARRELEGALSMARSLGARRFEASSLLFLGRLRAMLGRRAEARTMIEQSVALCRETGLAYVGPIAFGVLAWVSDSAVVRARALDEGEGILRAGTASHNYTFFYRDAMEMALGLGDHAAVEHYAGALEQYTRAQPLPWSRFFIDRGRALSAHARGVRGDELFATLDRLYRQARQVGFHVAAEAVGRALATAR